MQILINPIDQKSYKAAIIPLFQGTSVASAFSLNRIDITSIPFESIDEDLQHNGSKPIEIYTSSGTRVFLLKLTEVSNVRTLIQLARKIAHHHPHLFVGSILLGVKHLSEDQQKLLVDGFLNGILLGSYQIGKYQSDKAPVRFDPQQIQLDLFATLEQEELEAICQRSLAIAETQLEIMRLVDAPSNKKLPEDIADWALHSGKTNDYRVRALDKKQIEALGLHALLAVNQASPSPPRFIIAEYSPANTKNLPTITLVGKGVTFDTGGLSLKPSNNMHFMKSDMGGAAAVLGTLEVVAKLKLPVRLVGIVPSTDNSIGSMAVKPSDVIGSYSGKTIEVIDTDAEGRLILADGLAYSLQHHPADTLIDVATLTGSIIRTLGYSAGGLFTNSEDLAEELLAAGTASGERLWRLPIWEEYGDQMKSDVADIKNFSGKPMAGAITAAKFLQFFTQEHPRWAHLDIAGMAMTDSEFSKQKGATGFGIRLLLTFIEATIRNHSS